MKRVWPIVATTAALAAVLFATSTAPAQATPTPTRHVTIVLAPFLNWDDISPTKTPAIWHLAEQGALAGVNARSRVRQSGVGATPLEGALALSAGAWALPEWGAQAAYNATETHAGATAADVYRRAFDAPMSPAEIGYLGLPMTERANANRSVDVVLGTLGQAVRDAGGLTAAIGNSDTGFSDSDAAMQRPAAIVAMDASGRVDYGDVSADLIVARTGAPFGRATDMTRFADAFTRVSGLAATHDGPSLVVLDAGDLARARAFAWQVTDEVATRQRDEALSALDSVVAMADAKRGSDATVILASQALFADTAGAPEGLGPLVIAGPGYSGFATSSSTHRRGLVTNLDITATAFDALGLNRPVQVLGNPMSTLPGPATIEQRVAHLNAANEAYIAVDGIKSAVSGAILTLALVAIGLTVFVSWLAPRLSGGAVNAWTALLKAGLLLVLALPVSGWLAGLAVALPSSSQAALAAFSAVAALLMVAAFVATQRVCLRVPVAGLSLLTAAVLIVEQFFGAPFSIVSALGYSPLLGARYYGMGNEAAALAFGSLVVGVALLLDEWPDARASTAVRSWGMAAIGACFVAVAAAPFLGANVGVAIWGTAGFATAWLLLRGRPVTARSALVVVALVAVVILAFSALDLYGGGEQTHLGRAWAGAEQGGLGTLWTIVARKANANSRVLSTTGLSWILAAVAGLVVFARWRPGSDWPELLADNPHLAKIATAATVAGVVAFFSEDSGIAIPSLIALYVGVAIAWLMVDRLASGRGGARR